MADTKTRELHPEVSDSISIYIFFWLWMFSIIAAANATGLTNAYGAINPVVMFSLGGLGLIALAVREARTSGELISAFGFKTPISGMWIFSIFNGIGVGILIWLLFTGQLSSISGSTLITSVAQPFYNPYTASATPFLLGSLASISFGVLFINAYVAFFEELYKLGMIKILADWLYRKTGIQATSASLISIIVTFALWGTWHYFSWPKLTIASIMMAILYGFLFYSAYLVLGTTDLIPTGEIGSADFTHVLSGIIIYPAIASHWTWDVLISTSGAGLDNGTLLIIGITFTVLSALGLYISRKILG